MYDDRNNKTTAHHERGLLARVVRTEKVNNNYNIVWEPITTVSAVSSAATASLYTWRTVLHYNNDYHVFYLLWII